MSAEPGSAAAGPPEAQASTTAQQPSGKDEHHPPVITVVLVRHGRSTANTAGILAGRTPGVNLDEHGREQADAVAQRLAGTRFDRLISSPLDRCKQTVTPLSDAIGVPIEFEDRFAEVDYGDWSGRPLKELATEPLWRTVQQHASAAVFPGGEGLAAVSSRATGAIRDIRLAATSDQTVLICSHGDVIKSILADALCMHLDSFQRIVVAPASISVIRYTPHRPFVERINDTGDLGSISPHPAPKASDDAAAPADQGAPTVASAPSAPSTSSDAVPGGVTS